MSRIPAIWRLGITVAVLIDAVCFWMLLADRYSFRPYPNPYGSSRAWVSFDPIPYLMAAAIPWGLLLIAWLIGWTVRGFTKKKADV
jgi:hypothetical protein